MAKTNKIVNALSISALAGVMASVIVSSSAFAAVDAYTVKVGDSVFEYNTKDLQESFLASKAGSPSVLYTNFTAKIAAAKEFYAFHDAKTGRYIGNDDVTNAFLADRTNFKLDAYVEADKAVAVATLPQVIKSVTVVGGEIVLTDKQTSSIATIASVSATGTKTVKVTFGKAVDTTKAVLNIKKGAAIYGSTVAWNDAKDTATLTTVVNLPAADYTVDVTGLTTTALTKAFTVAAEAATKVEIVSTTVALIDSSTIAFKVSNQYGEDMKINGTVPGVVVSAYNTTQKRVEALTNLTADNKLTLSATFASITPAKLGDVIRITVTYAGLTAQSMLQ
jgi:membrane-associated protease RseP (regulator of RpoE activity)